MTSRLLSVFRHSLPLLVAVLAVISTAALVAVACSAGPQPTAPAPTSAPRPAAADNELSRLFKERASGVEVQGEGTVTRILADDETGGRHQRFVLRLASGQTLLISHNIDIAPRVTGLDVGERVSFKGVYEWNAEGGVVHWTHHDPAGEHIPGWIEHGGETFQ